VLGECANCVHARRVADAIRREYPQVTVRLVDLEKPEEPIPDAVFAAPTYLLDGRVWSLGNPSPQEIRDTLSILE
jgi:hypothetical protein